MKTFNWKPTATKYHVNQHLRTLNAGIQYYKNRNQTEKAKELEAEKSSLISFYFNGNKN